ncbi:hypothetical protein HS121_01950 [bacterium]|nr:hypothetical protein [bacterium]
MTHPPYTDRVLAFDPISRGLGIVVFESPSLPIEWGIKEVRDRKEERCLTLVADLLDRFQPDIVVMEDTETSICRRCQRVRSLIHSIGAFSASRHVPTALVTRDQVHSTFGVSTKHQVATVIASRLSELAPFLPPFRKPWKSEDPRMSLFDATAFALTYYHLKEQWEAHAA